MEWDLASDRFPEERWGNYASPNFIAGEDGGVVEDGRCGDETPDGGNGRILLG